MLNGDTLAPCSTCKCIGGLRTAEMGYAQIFNEDGTMTLRESCPRADITHESAFLFQLHQRSRDYSALPFPGSVSEQPERVMQAFAIIDSRLGWWDKRRKAEAARKAKNKNGS